MLSKWEKVLSDTTLTPKHLIRDLLSNCFYYFTCISLENIQRIFCLALTLAPFWGCTWMFSKLVSHDITNWYHTISRGLGPQFSGLTITGTKERFSRPGRFIAPKTHSTEMTGHYSNLFPRAYSAFNMADGRGEDPNLEDPPRNTPWIVEYFVTWHSMKCRLRYTWSAVPRIKMATKFSFNVASRCFLLQNNVSVDRWISK